MIRKPMTLRAVMKWCTMAHGNQMYERKGIKGGTRNLHYSFHLRGVDKVAIRFGFGRRLSIRKVCWAHDVLEDTNFTAIDMIDAGFTPFEVAMVDACTDGEGKTRRQRKQRVYRLIPLIPPAVFPKLFDRTFNLEYSILQGNERMYRTYKREHPEFKRRLCDPNDAQAAPIWAHLDRLLTPAGKAEFLRKHSSAKR